MSAVLLKTKSGFDVEFTEIEELTWRLELSGKMKSVWSVNIFHPRKKRV